MGKTFLTARSFARTEGYYPPEIVRGQISPKSDVYSYGVVRLTDNCILEEHHMNTFGLFHATGLFGGLYTDESL